MDDRVTLRLSPIDVAHLDALRGHVPRGPFLRSLLRDAAASSGTPVPPSSEQQHLERLRALTTR